VVAEGARPKGGKMVINKIIKSSPEPVRLGGIGNKIAGDIEKNTGLETRVTNLGHLQRGGTPSPFDRMLATRLGTFACDLVAKGDFGKMAALKGNNIVAVSLKDAVKSNRRVSPNHPIIKSAIAVGTSFAA
ncbi:MAG: 6-phosphofructokinase, partial [Candidatus Omnitrophica bacterium]|nr:6-phosphofructokinase [Candidatus Omnitrophota bacterium]